MRSIASSVLIIAVGLGLIACSGGGGGGSSSSSAFAVSTTAADFGVVGNIYTSTLVATGGTAPFTWTASGGGLPPDLSLDAGTGDVSSTLPLTVAGNSTVVFVVTDSTGMTATGLVLFAIHPRTDRVSVDGTGTTGNGASSTPSINGDGSLVAFVSQATNLVIGVSGFQIYVHNRQTNQVEVISRDNDTTTVNKGNGDSSAPSISAGGRFVAFVSVATNLLAPGPAVPAGQQIYVRDRQTGLTSVVSVDNNGVPNPGTGASSAPSISADGRFVAFVSVATNLLAPGPAVPAGQQIYVRDRQTGLTSLVSVDNNGVPNPGTGTSGAPSISADGRFVAFVSVATNLLAPGPAVPAGQQIYVRGLRVNQTSLASADNNVVPIPGNGVSSAPSINVDGSLVAFDSLATNLLDPVVPSVSGRQVYIRNRTAGQTSLVSTDNNVAPNPGNGVSRTPSISSNGRFVAFVSSATDLLAPGVLAVAGQQIYIRDRQLGQSFLASQDNTNTNVAGAGGGGVSDTPSTNGNGGFVAFFSRATNLVTAPPAAPSDIYVRAIP